MNKFTDFLVAFYGSGDDDAQVLKFVGTLMLIVTIVFGLGILLPGVMLVTLLCVVGVIVTFPILYLIYSFIRFALTAG